MGDLVRYEAEDGVVILTLNRPERLNAITAALITELQQALNRADDDPDVRVVVLTGAGRAFCAGGDLNPPRDDRPPGTAPVTAAQQVATVQRLVAVAGMLHEMTPVTIAAVNGACAGGGLSLACACDLRYAADSAVFSPAFLAAGLPGDYGITWSLPRLVGPAKARELLLVADRFGAAQAKELGLVCDVFPAAELGSQARAVAARLTSAAPLAVQALKANLNDAETSSFGDALRREAERLVPCLRSDDFAEAARAFLAKRPPVFHGR